VIDKYYWSFGPANKFAEFLANRLMQKTREGAIQVVGPRSIPRRGLGCLDVRCAELEIPQTIVARIHKAFEYVGAERLTLNPDCGFAPSGTNPVPLDEAYTKLKALVQATREPRHHE
jgi:hypothetical protein